MGPDRFSEVLRVFYNFWRVLGLLLRSLQPPHTPHKPLKTSENLSELSENAFTLFILPRGLAYIEQISAKARMLENWLSVHFPWTFQLSVLNGAHQQCCLLDTILNYILHFGPLENVYIVYLSPPNPLHVGRRSWPTCNRVSWFDYRCFPGGPK